MVQDLGFQDLGLPECRVLGLGAEGVESPVLRRSMRLVEFGLGEVFNPQGCEGRCEKVFLGYIHKRRSSSS